MKMTVEQLDMHIRRHSTQSTKWVILTNEKGEPLKYDPAYLTFRPSLWYHASLFTQENAADLAEQASMMMGGDMVGTVTLVGYLDKLRDDMVRAERRETREVIHG
ncbi:MAG: hypothetical protein ACRCXB_23435 [Aeromonadaceae bacterium]